MKPTKVEFNIWCDDEEEGKILSEEIQKFINYHGEQGRAVTANKVKIAISKWQDNFLVKNRIIKYFENGE